MIQAHRVKGTTRYLYTGELWGTRLDANQALLMIIGLYTQQRGLLRDHFESVISELLRDLLVKISALKNTYKEVEQYVYISGFGPADPPRSISRIREIMRAIRLRKTVRLEYLRSYDGATTKREVEPYGLICRFNNWYLVAFCLQRQGRRVFLLDTATYPHRDEDGDVLVEEPMYDHTPLIIIDQEMNKSSLKRRAL